MERLYLAIVIVVVVGGGGVVAGIVTGGGGADATIALEVVSEANDTVEVELSTTAANAAGYEANITYDPTVAELVAIEGVDFGDPVSNVDDEVGWVTLTQAQGSGVDAPTFARMTFTLAGDGQTELSFVEYDTVVNDEDRELLELSYSGTELGSAERTVDGSESSSETEENGDESPPETESSESSDDSDVLTETPETDRTDDEPSESDDDALPPPGFVALLLAIAFGVYITDRT